MPKTRGERIVKFPIPPGAMSPTTGLTCQGQIGNKHNCLECYPAQWHYKKRHPFPRCPGCIHRYAFLTSYQEFDENLIANIGLEMSRYNCCIVLKKKICLLYVGCYFAEKDRHVDIKSLTSALLQRLQLYLLPYASAVIPRAKTISPKASLVQDGPSVIH